MDYTTIITGTLALAGLVGMAFLGGYQIGEATAGDNQRAADNERRIDAVVAYENNRRPKARKNRVKASRKAVRA